MNVRLGRANHDGWEVAVRIAAFAIAWLSKKMTGRRAGPVVGGPLKVAIEIGLFNYADYLILGSYFGQRVSPTVH